MNDNENIRRFRDRTEAGRLLASQLVRYVSRPNLLILALPRGGVPVAFEIARTLHAPLDIFLVRKLGVPGQEELAMGASRQRQCASTAIRRSGSFSDSAIRYRSL